MIESYFLENSHRLLWVDTDNRHIIPMKSRGFSHTPQDILEEYNGCSVPQYTAYSLKRIRVCGFSEDPNDELIPPFSIFCVRC